MRKIKRFVRKHPRCSYASYVTVVLIACALTFLIISTSRLPGTVWLPDSITYTSDDDVMFGLPVKSRTVRTAYGAAVRYTSPIDRSADYKDPQASTVIDEFRANPRLRASACPDIAGTGSLLPSGCANVGTFEGNPVYRISRRLPSTTVEYFVQIKGTFIYARCGDGGPDYNYFRDFVSFPRQKAGGYLATNNARAEQIIKKRLAGNAATKQLDDSSYTRLNFTPALATAVPTGWSLEGNEPKNVRLDGPDAEHPELVFTDYYVKQKNGQKGKSISWYSGNLADFAVMDSCGPTPGYSMEYLPCSKVPGTDYYAAELYDGLNDYVRYTYYPVGSSLVITGLFGSPNIGKSAPEITELIAAQNQITESAKPINKNSLKGSTYYQAYNYQ